MSRHFLEGYPDLFKGPLFIACVLLFNAFAWYFMTISILGDLFKDSIYSQNIVSAVYHTAVIGSSIVGAILSSRIKRLHLLYFWMGLGTCVSFLPVLFAEMTMTHTLNIYFLWGISFGLGMPSCLAYFSDSTLVENRGHVSGVLLLFILISFGIFGLITDFVILTVWRGLGLILFILLRPKKIIAPEITKEIPFKSIVGDRSFFLYFIPWLIFCFIDRFEEPILKPFLGPFPDFLRGMLLIVGSLAAAIGGVFSDWVGRKRVILYGFVTLGLAYAIIGIAPAELVSWYFYISVVSVASGIFWVIFIFVLWGDLSQYGVREKYYAIGSIPFFLTGIIESFSAPYIMLISPFSAFSLASFFLFLAVLPLLYAPETLPEKKIKLRQFRKYVEKAKKVKEKH